MQPEFHGNGTYRHLYWDLMLHGDTITDTHELMCLHELFHSDLDTSTDFGSLLCAYAHLRDVFGDSSTYTEVHRSLLRCSLRTHEIGATFLSLLAVSDPGCTNWSNYQLGTYETYLQLGLELCKELSGRFFRFHAVLAAIKVCMQAPVTALALEHGLETFKLRDLKSTMMPNDRYLRVRQITSIPGFWNRTIDNIRQNIKHPDWDVALETEISDGAFKELFGSESDGISTILLKGFHESIASQLEAFGMPTLSYDGHTATASAVVEACNALTQSQRMCNSKLSVGTQLHPSLGLVQNLERERIVVQTQPIPAAILSISVEEYISQIQDSLKDPRFAHYIAVRWPNRLIKQYKFDQASEHLFQNENKYPWCFIQSSVNYENQKHITIVPLRRPNDLTILARSAHCFSSVSNAILNKTGWESWHKALADKTFMTVLLDTSPFRQIEQWAKGDIIKISFGQINAKNQNGRYPIFWLKPDEKTLFLAPCSYVMTVAIKTYLERISHILGVKIETYELQGEPLLKLKPILYHLFEEMSFDFVLD